MTATWNRPQLAHLAQRLADVRTRLQAVTPQLVQAQVSAVGRMAEIVRAAAAKPPEGRS
jgi:hypothetical protein